ncbi:MAG: hypothetical protein D3910_24140, partial [Candidatus Electrothrix sp. ATG2]|nr:hypothetical protein [Candidatus Electrothrix sp. ATG2]
ADDSEKDHAGLIGDYLSEIKSFLTEGTAPAEAKAFTMLDIESSEQTEPVFSVSVHGSVRVDVTNSVGQHVGIDPSTGALLNEVTSAEVFFEGDNGEINIEGPMEGTYHITIFGAPDRDFRIDVGFQNETETEYKPLQAYCSDDQMTFDVVVNIGSSPHITILPPVVSPENLQANPASASGAETTTLTWNASSETSVNGYAVYSVTETAPYFSKIATVPSGITNFATDDLGWR